MSATVTATAIAAGANWLTNQYNAWQTRRNNKQAQKYAKEAYMWERNASVNDWHRDNAYNHPEQQMARLRQAGLNPHLVYGKGADTQAAMSKSASAKPSRPNAPPVVSLPIVT